MFGKLYTGLTALFSHTARRDRILGAIGRALADGDTGAAARQAGKLVRGFIADPAIVAPLEAVAGQLCRDGAADSALGLALQAYRLAADDSPLRACADRLCRTLADAPPDAAGRLAVWGDLARIAAADTPLRRDARARWESLVAALPDAADRTAACLDMMEMTYRDGTAKNPLRRRAMELASENATHMTDGARLAAFCQRAAVLCDEFSPEETQWLAAWKRAVDTLPPAQARTATLEAAEKRLYEGRGENLLLRDFAADMLPGLARDMPPSPEKLSFLLRAAWCRQDLDGPDSAGEAATLWLVTLRTLPAAENDLRAKLALCFRAALDMGPDSALTRMALAEWDRLADLLPGPTEKRRTYLEAAAAARQWGDGHDRLARTLEKKAQDLLPKPPSSLSPGAFLRHFRAP